MKTCSKKMQKSTSDVTTEIWGQLGSCGGRQVFIGFATASTLIKSSFVDQLNEETGKGYQRRFHEKHSLEFKHYIQQDGASTIPLTFNLRPENNESWSLIHEGSSPTPAVLRIKHDSGPVMSQVDCQHRLGFLESSDISFAFMSYIGLSVAEEMELFRVINGKAKGLSGSLLDYTEARLSDNLSTVKPELYIALKLQETIHSPWYQKLDLGGKSTVGMKRQASLRTMQNGVKRFLKESKLPLGRVEAEGTQVLIGFWGAICTLLQAEWDSPRKHVLSKGVGVYALMSLAGTLYREALKTKQQVNCDYFTSVMSGFIGMIDWSNKGSFHGFGGVSGADKALALILLKRQESLGVVPLYG